MNGREAPTGGNGSGGARMQRRAEADTGTRLFWARAATGRARELGLKVFGFDRFRHTGIDVEEAVQGPLRNCSDRRKERVLYGMMLPERRSRVSPPFRPRDTS